MDNPRGFAMRYDMSNGDVVKVTNPLNQATQYAYDSRHNVTQVTDPLGNRTAFTYNAHDRVTQIVQVPETLNLTTTFAWSPDGEIPIGNLLSATNPKGARTDYTYDGKHNLTSVRRAAGRLSS